MKFYFMKKYALSLLIVMVILTSSACSSTKDTYDSPDTPEEVWGDLIEQEGDYVWNTLTAKQQELINYPDLDKNKVYWVSNGKSYHSIEWCYTLLKSENIVSGSIDKAINNGKSDPCSKCVGN